jgi:hypothetical protein
MDFAVVVLEANSSDGCALAELVISAAATTAPIFNIIFGIVWYLIL